MSLVPYDNDRPGRPFVPLPPRATSTRGPVLAGLAVILVAFGGFGTWAALAPLSSAAIASGVVSVESNRKTVQHLEGGIIEEILVKEGTVVSEGQVLLRLQETRTRAAYQLLLGQYRSALALEARLTAERGGLEEIVFAADLVAARADPEVAKMIAGQSRLFSERRGSLDSQISILRKRIRQQRQERGGLSAQVKAKNRQIVLIAEELEGLQKLFDKGYASKTRLLALKRAKANLEGDKGQLIAAIAELKQAVGEVESRIENLSDRFRTEVETELRATEAKLAELSDRLRAQKDVLQRIEIRAPQNGVVVGLKFHTKGGVVPPGAPLMDIVPTEDKLIIEAQVDVQDIDVVHAGLSAQIRFSAYKRRFTPTVDGTVTHVSADRFVSDTTGRPYYQAFIEIDPESLAELDDVELQPGMAAEAMIATGQRKALAYLVSPITDRFYRAFREE